ncbi:hypothetical protein [Bosea thiooxidans]
MPDVSLSHAPAEANAEPSTCGVRAAAIRPAVRRATKPTKASKERRLASKEKRSGVKAGRQKPIRLA